MILSLRQYYLLYFLLGLVYVGGLFVPLMNNDAAHHANIALHMYITGDYVSLIDQGKDYLDKPHLHFWLCALSYHLFGVNTFAYKIPSLVFSILGIYATFGLGRRLYNADVGRLAALILASSYAFILANNDVRMDAILTSCIIVSIWQAVEFVHTERWRNLIWCGIFLGAGFSAKGMIGLALPGIALCIYLISSRRWRMLFNWKWLILVGIVVISISPVLYAYYIQFDLHPEKTIRGQQGVSGVQFALWSQNIERLSGEKFGGSAGNDPFFFVHTFLWAFLPWSLLALLAFVYRAKRLVSTFRHQEQLTFLTTAVVFLIISFSGFKLPHYLNILFPLIAVMVAQYLNVRPWKDPRALFTVQVVIALLLITLVVILNAWAFPMRVPTALFALAVGIICYYMQTGQSIRRRIVLVSSGAAIISNFLFNFNFYPAVLTFQAGSQLARIAHGQPWKDEVYYLEGTERSNSYDFYTNRLTPSLNLDTIREGNSIYIYTGPTGIEKLRDHGLSFDSLAVNSDYRVSKLAIKFIRPDRRKAMLKKHYLLRVDGADHK